MSITFVPTQNQPGMDKFGHTEWRTNRTTGEVFRLDAKTAYVSREKRRTLPDFFRLSQNDPYREFVMLERYGKAKNLFAYGRKGYRLASRHNNNLFHYTLDAEMLGADQKTAAWLENPANYWNSATVEAWQRLLDTAFPGPYAWGLHVGENGRVHPHVLAGKRHNVPNPPRDDPEWRKRRENTTNSYAWTLAYIQPKVPPTPANVRFYEKAVKVAGGACHLPQHSGFRGFRAVKRVRKPSKNIVSDGAAKKVTPLNGVAATPQPMTLERFERVMFPWAGSSYRRVWTPNSPPARGSP